MSGYLDEIQARADAATDGPWLFAWDGETWTVKTENGPVSGENPDRVALEVEHADAAFIAHARTDIPRLVAALRAVEALCGAARPSLSIPPLDCTGSCSDGPCDCSGVFRVRAWDLDPDRIRTAIRDALEAR